MNTFSNPDLRAKKISAKETFSVEFQLTLEQMRRMASTIYDWHGVRVIRWTDGLDGELESATPRSHHDFVEDLEQAVKEIRELFGLDESSS